MASKTYPILAMSILQTRNLTRDSRRQPPVDTSFNITEVHVLERSRRSRLPEIDGLIVPLGIPDHHEASAADARMVHGDDADAECRAHHGVDGISLHDGGELYPLHPPRRASLPEVEGKTRRLYMRLTPRARRSRPIWLHSRDSLATPPLDPGLGSGRKTTESGTGLAAVRPNKAWTARSRTRDEPDKMVSKVFFLFRFCERVDRLLTHCYPCPGIAATYLLRIDALNNAGTLPERISHQTYICMRYVCTD